MLKIPGLTGTFCGGEEVTLDAGDTEEEESDLVAAMLEMGTKAIGWFWANCLRKPSSMVKRRVLQSSVGDHFLPSSCVDLPVGTARSVPAGLKATLETALVCSVSTASPVPLITSNN